MNILERISTSPPFASFCVALVGLLSVLISTAISQIFTGFYSRQRLLKEQDENRKKEAIRNALNALGKLLDIVNYQWFYPTEVSIDYEIAIEEYKEFVEYQQKQIFEVFSTHGLLVHGLFIKDEIKRDEFNKIAHNIIKSHLSLKSWIWRVSDVLNTDPSEGSRIELDNYNLGSAMNPVEIWAHDEYIRRTPSTIFKEINNYIYKAISIINS